MSMLRDAIKRGGNDWLRGIVALDATPMISAAADHDPMKLSGCRSPFTSELTSKVASEHPLRHGARICAWYEFGLGQGGYGVSVVVAEMEQPEIGMRRQALQVWIRRNNEIPWPCMDGRIDFDESWTPEKFSWDYRTYAKAIVPEGDEIARDLFNNVLKLVTFTNSVANCKNVRLVRDDSGRKPIHRHRERKEHRGLVWHRLMIRPHGGASRESTRSGGEVAMTRWHVQRGHFKTYTPEAPLLGRHVGKWWWSPHARGDKSVGVALKDYAIAPEASRG